MTQQRPRSEACERNKDAILQVLRRLLGHRDRVLEVGSGTGQHAVHFAAALPEVHWTCSDLPCNHAGITAWLSDAGLCNLQGPLALDVRDRPWPLQAPVDAVFSANTAHIMHMDGVRGLFRGAGDHLRPGGLLLLYGPFSFGGEHVGDGNRRFDAALRAGDPGMGIRDLHELDEMAGESGLARSHCERMPANNFTAVWQRMC
jgi:cyclopropane fatty-acyl-phospholipid synthase-like methyltransferase